MQSHVLILRLGASTALVDRRVSLDLNRELLGQCTVWLSKWRVDTPSSAFLRVRVLEPPQMRSPQNAVARTRGLALNSTSEGVYLLGTGATATIDENHLIPVTQTLGTNDKVTALQVEVSDWDGAAVTYTDLTLYCLTSTRLSIPRVPLDYPPRADADETLRLVGILPTH